MLVQVIAIALQRIERYRWPAIATDFFANIEIGFGRVTKQQTRPGRHILARTAGQQNVITGRLCSGPAVLLWLVFTLSIHIIDDPGDLDGSVFARRTGFFADLDHVENDTRSPVGVSTHL